VQEDVLFESFFNVQMVVKLGVLAVASPVWVPVVKAVWHELQQAMAADGGVFGRAKFEMPPRERIHDPFWSIPLASQRGGRGAGRPASAGSAQRSASGGRGTGRRAGGAPPGSSAPPGTERAQRSQAAPPARRAARGSVRRPGF